MITSKSILYFTQAAYDIHAPGLCAYRYGNVIEVISRRKLPNFANGNDYFEITYRYIV